MSPDQIAPTLIICWILYWIVRFILFELLTGILRRVPRARSWLRHQTAAGRFDRNVRSSALFSNAFRLLAEGAEWVVGRGWLRAPTFVFVATILIFLSVLPMDQVRAARNQYDTALAALRTVDVAQTAMATCALETAFAEASRRTGLSLSPPPSFQPYPFDGNDSETWRALGGERLSFMAFALMDGRRLTDDPAEIDPALRQYFPWVGRDIDAKTVDGRLTQDTFKFLPPDPLSQAASEDIRALCDQDPDTRSRTLTPVRDPAAYAGIVERVRAKALATLESATVRETFNTFQVKVAASRFGIAFFLALAPAVVLWISLKLMIFVCRVPRRSIWLIANYALVLGTSSVGAFVISGTLLGSREVVNAVVPFASGYLLAVAADPASETESQRQANAFIGEAVALSDATCAEIGSASPFSGWCETLELMAEPWDAASRTFAFERLIPQEEMNDPAYTYLMGKVTSAPMTFAFAYMGVDKENQDRFSISFWQGVTMGSFMLLVLAPWLLLCGLATLLAPLLELRWTVVKRIDRIVRERGSRNSRRPD
jgi:hypothetical protein